MENHISILASILCGAVRTSVARDHSELGRCAQECGWENESRTEPVPLGPQDTSCGHPVRGV